MTNKVFSVILFAYVEGLAASVKLDRERLSASPVSLLFSDLMAITPPQTGSSPAQQIVRNRTNDNVSQKETSRAHDTDGRVKLLAHRLGNSRLTLLCNV